MADPLTQLRELLRELFQLDNADLDFGIYRVMNLRRAEITRFLDHDLLPQVKESFKQYQSSDVVGLTQELNKLLQQAAEMGVADPDSLPKVKHLRDQLGSSVDLAALEQQVFSDLYAFFRRYYQDGDFLSLRRYKAGVYAIPYEGEEVKLHWANADQYYIKTSEYLRDYTFTVSGGKRVHFRLADADTEKDNNKAAAGNERRFILAGGDDAVAEVGGELICRFDYRPDPDKRKQADLSKLAEQRIGDLASAAWSAALTAARAESASDPKPSVLRHHLTQYTARNTFDYFIHKDLGGFLRRELDFYVKNEVMHLDDIESATVPQVEQYLSRIKVLRLVAHKIIAFLAQIEDFQKKLWLKKKFVVATDYLVTVDRIPDGNTGRTASLAATPNVTPSATPVSGSKTRECDSETRVHDPKTRECDSETRVYDPKTSENDSETRGYNSETRVYNSKTRENNSEARERDSETDVQATATVATDDMALRAPRTGDLRQVVAENPRQWAQWESLGFRPAETPLGSPDWATRAYLDANDKLVVDTALFDRDFIAKLLASDDVLAGKPTLDEATTGVLFHSENFQALSLMQERFGGEITAVYADPPYNTDAAPINYKNGYKDGSWLSLMADRLVLAASLTTSNAITCLTIDDVEVHQLRLLIERSLSMVQLLGVIAIKNNPAGRTGTVGLSIMHEYALFYGDSGNARVGRLEHSAEQKARYKEADETGAFEWTNFRKHGGGNTYRTTRPRQYYPIYVRGEVVRIPLLSWNADLRTYDVLEKPVAGEVVIYPIDSQGRERIWDFVVETARTNLPHLRVKADGRGEVGVYRKWRINNEGLLPPTVWEKSKYSAAEYGTNLLARMFGRTHSFSFPKSVHAVEDCLRVCGVGLVDDGWVLDFFGGSGTTAHAVLNLNREDEADGESADRRFILVEMGEYFQTVLKPRIAKVMYSPDWKDGRAASHGKGTSGLVKVLRLEGYEDTLNNLRLTRTAGQADLLSQNKTLAEEYTLGYLLDAEARGSASLLNVDGFADPFAYQLDVATGTAGETKPTNVDLIETFNWLLGLRVASMATIAGIRVVEGTNPQGEKVLILWRRLADWPSDKLDGWLTKQKITPRDMEFDLIYVNGDNQLENLRRDDEAWKVRLIEEEFGRLMFDVADV